MSAEASGLMTVREAAARLRMSQAAVRDLVKAGKLKHTRPTLSGRRVFLFADDIERHIREATVEGDYNADLSHVTRIKIGRNRRRLA